MKANYRLFKRGGYYYGQDKVTRKQTSLHTTNRMEAERLLAAKNEAANTNSLALAVGQIYLKATDSGLMTRTWADVMKIMTQRGGDSTQARTQRALASRPAIVPFLIWAVVGLVFWRIYDQHKGR